MAVAEIPIAFDESVITDVLTGLHNIKKRALIEAGEEAYVRGALIANHKMGVAYTFDLVKAEAVDYIASSYAPLILDRGGSMCFDADRGIFFVDWLNTNAVYEREQVLSIIRAGISDGTPMTGKNSLADRLGGFFNARKRHAETVARTETAKIQLQGTSNRLKNLGVSKVKILDGGISPDGEPYGCLCPEKDGEIWTLEYYNDHLIEHPNCTRDIVPVIPER